MWSVKEEKHRRLTFSKRTISLFTLWITSEYAFIVSEIKTTDAFKIGVLVFYTTFTLYLFVQVLATGVVLDKEEEVKELMGYDTVQAMPGFFVGSIVALAISAPIQIFSGAKFGGLTFEQIIEQLLIIVPNETFQFIFFLPKLIRRLFWLPGWVWAQVTFALFHYVAYDLDILSMFSAFVIGVFWYHAYMMGKKYPYMGLSFVIAFHFVYNIIALSTQASIDPAVAIFLTLFSFFG